MNNIAKEFVLKVALILTKRDEDFKLGTDPFVNAQSYIHSFMKNSNMEMIKYLEDNMDLMADISDLHPQRINWIIQECKRWV